MVEVLVAAGADPEARNGSGHTPLHEAAGRGEPGSVSVVEALLAAGADPMARYGNDETLLHVMAEKEDAAPVVLALLAAGAEVAARDDQSETPLHVAARHERTAVVEVLLAAGADARVRDSGENTPLHEAVRDGGDRAVVEMLLAAGADVAARNDDGETPLQTAVRSSSPWSGAAWTADVGVVEALLAAGANVAAQDDEGETPLHVAARAADVGVLEALLAAGADVAAQDDEGETPLHVAARAADVGVLEALLAAGADVTAQDNDGDTALHRAAEVGVVGILLAAGADPTVRNATGETPPASWRFWQSIMNSTNPTDFEAYLEQFPNGLFRARAAGRLAVLDPEARARRSAARPPRRPVGADARLQPGAVFRDCEWCPEMVVLAEGQLALGRYEVTVGEYRAFASRTGGGAGGGCFSEDGDSWRDPGFPQTDRHPVTCVSWDDAQAYVSWLSRTAGTTYRLPTAADWELAAAGSRPGCHEERTGNRGTCPVGSYGANGVGLFDVVGNLWEWTEDCWEGDCARRVMRGASWGSPAQFRRPGALGVERTDRRDPRNGFRVASTLD